MPTGYRETFKQIVAHEVTNGAKDFEYDKRATLTAMTRVLKKLTNAIEGDDENAYLTALTLAAIVAEKAVMLYDQDK